MTVRCANCGHAEKFHQTFYDGAIRPFPCDVEMGEGELCECNNFKPWTPAQQETRRQDDARVAELNRRSKC
jgi:hypothetical protein